MAIFIGTDKNSGQVSICGDVYGRCLTHLRQHLALFILNDRPERREVKRSKNMNSRGSTEIKGLYHGIGNASRKAGTLPACPWSTPGRK